MNIMVIPAIIPESLEYLGSRVRQVKDHVERVQIDIADGLFAPTKTWPLNDWRSFEPIINGEEGLPYWESVNYEVHLMVQDPYKHLDEWIAAGATAIIPHASMIEEPHLMRDRLKELDIEFGIAVTPMEYQQIDDQLFTLADFIQVMGSNDIGHHGAELMDEAVELIKHLAKSTDKPIAIDIGVSVETAPRLVRAGATRLVSGSAIFHSDDARTTIAELKQEKE